MHLFRHPFTANEHPRRQRHRRQNRPPSQLSPSNLSAPRRCHRPQKLLELSIKRVDVFLRIGWTSHFPHYGYVFGKPFGELETRQEDGDDVLLFCDGMPKFPTQPVVLAGKCRVHRPVEASLVQHDDKVRALVDPLQQRLVEPPAPQRVEVECDAVPIPRQMLVQVVGGLEPAFPPVADENVPLHAVLTHCHFPHSCYPSLFPVRKPRFPFPSPVPTFPARKRPSSLPPLNGADTARPPRRPPNPPNSGKPRLFGTPCRGNAP